MKTTTISVPHPSQASLTGNKLRVRYITALSIIAFLTISSQLVIQSALHSQENDSHIVNIAGRQRMLTQKIAKVSGNLAAPQAEDDIAALRQELAEAAALWKRTHQDLQNGNPKLGLPGDNSPDIALLFAQIAGNHRVIVAAVAQILAPTGGEGLMSQALASIRNNEAAFLKGMNEIVSRYDLEAREKVRFTKIMELLLAVVTLSVLLLEALYIFAPAARRITADMLELIKREEDLETLFEVSPIVKLLVDPDDYSIIRVNHRAHSALNLADATSPHLKLTDFIDNQYHNNRAFMEKLENADTLDEYEIVILCAAKDSYPMLASVRKINLRGEEVIVVGMTDISEIKKAQEALKRHASIDEMTGMLNRRTGTIMLQKLMAQSVRNNKELTVCFMDIDGLKIANDQHGHKSGDWLITTIAHVTTELLRKSDVVARIGGDEFIAIFPECDIPSANAKMAVIQGRLNEIQSEENRPFPIGFSFGVASYPPDSTHSAAELIEEADRQMYADKRSKKDHNDRPDSPPGGRSIAS